MHMGLQFAFDRVHGLHSQNKWCLEARKQDNVKKLKISCKCTIHLHVAYIFYIESDDKTK